MIDYFRYFGSNGSKLIPTGNINKLQSEFKIRMTTSQVYKIIDIISNNERYSEHELQRVISPITSIPKDLEHLAHVLCQNPLGIGKMHGYKLFLVASLMGSQDAKFAQAKLLFQGFRGLQSDKITANESILALAKLGHPKANHAMGIDALAKKLYKKAVRCFSIAADKGHGASQLILGNWYGKGYQVSKDLDKSFEYLEKAYQNGIFEAAVSLSGLYTSGTPSIKSNSKKSFELLTIAANQGIAIAQCNLADMYFEGSDYVVANPYFAIEYSKMAADQKLIASQFFLAKLCQTGYKFKLGDVSHEIAIDLQMSKKNYQKVVSDFDGHNFGDLVQKAKIELRNLEQIDILTNVVSKSAIM